MLIQKKHLVNFNTHFRFKILSFQIERNFFNLIKGIDFQYHVVVKTFEIFPLKSGTRQEYPLHSRNLPLF